MDKTVAKDILYGGIAELMNNRDLYYKSSFNASYSKWTDKGLEAVTEFVNIMSPHIHQIELDIIENNSKALVLNSLKVTDAV